MRSYCVLAPQYEGPWGIDALNTVLQAALNPPDNRKRECVGGMACCVWATGWCGRAM